MVSWSNIYKGKKWRSCETVLCFSSSRQRVTGYSCYTRTNGLANCDDNFSMILSTSIAFRSSLTSSRYPNWIQTSGCRLIWCFTPSLHFSKSLLFLEEMSAYNSILDWDELNSFLLESMPIYLLTTRTCWFDIGYCRCFFSWLEMKWFWQLIRESLRWSQLIDFCTICNWITSQIYSSHFYSSHFTPPPPFGFGQIQWFFTAVNNSFLLNLIYVITTGWLVIETGAMLDSLADLEQLHKLI